MFEEVSVCLVAQNVPNVFVLVGGVLRWSRNDHMLPYGGLEVHGTVLRGGSVTILIHL